MEPDQSNQSQFQQALNRFKAKESKQPEEQKPAAPKKKISAWGGAINRMVEEIKTSERFKQEITTSKGQAITQVHEAESSSYHSYSPEELMAFTQIINNALAHDEDLSHILPIDPNSEGLFDACTNGVLLCKLINQAVPDTIFEKSINMRRNLNLFQQNENLTLALRAASSIGCKIVSIVPESIMGKKEHLVLGLIWQIIRILMLATVNLKQHPELILLLEQDEELGTLLKLPPEEILLRWFNYHLKRANSERRVTNFASDLKDGVCYTTLLNQIDRERCSLAGLQASSDLERAAMVIQSAQEIGVETVSTPRDITSGNQKLNILFSAAIFNNNPGLYATEQELYEAAQLLDDDIEGTREERSFRMWINSLNIEGVYVNNLFEEVKDGLTIIKVLEKLDPSMVQWNQVESRVNNRIRKISNCNYLIQLGRQLGFNLVSVAGVDFVDGKKKLILGYVWQLVRYATFRLLGNFNEQQLLKWANERVTDIQINDFKDKSLGTGIFLLKLYSTIEPRAIDQTIVTEGSNDLEKEQNAKYVISVARKLGASIFCTWEDIVEVNSKMIITLIASAAHLAESYSSLD